MDQERPWERAERDQIANKAGIKKLKKAMKDKLNEARLKGRGGWQDKDDCSQQHLSDLLREHVEKGDPVDVANFCMMLHYRRESIVPALAKPASSPAGRDVLRQAADIVERLPWHNAETIAHRMREAALSPSTSAAEPVAWIANCCHCGRIVDTREEKEGGDEFGCEMSDGRWTCSPECWDAVVEPDATPPAPAAVDGQRVKAPLDAEDEMDPAGRIRACLAKGA